VEWHEIFPTASSVVTLVDRLTYEAEIIQTEGESYRLKESRERAKKRVTRRADKKRTKKLLTNVAQQRCQHQSVAMLAFIGGFGVAVTAPTC
jgi:hypothetical protein